MINNLYTYNINFILKIFNLLLINIYCTYCKGSKLFENHKPDLFKTKLELRPATRTVMNGPEIKNHFSYQGRVEE